MTSIETVSYLRQNDPNLLINTVESYLNGGVEDYLVFIEAGKAAEEISNVLAYDLYFRALKIHPNDHAYSTLIQYLVRIQSIEEANSLFLKAVELFGPIPALSEIACFMGAEARSIISSSLARLPMDITIEHATSIATCLCSVGKLSQAVDLINAHTNIHYIHRSRYIFTALMHSGIIKSSTIDSIFDNSIHESFKDGELKIFQYWDKIEAPNDVNKLFVDNAISCNGRHEIRHKNDFYSQTLKFYDETHAKLIIDYCEHPSAQSDIFRWTRLFETGGVYLDADMRLVEKDFFTKALETNVNFIPWADELQFPCISNWIIRFSSKSRLFEETAKLIGVLLEDEPSIGSSLTMFDITGPGILTHVFVKNYLEGKFFDDFVFVTETSLHKYFNYGSNLNYKKNPETYWPLLQNKNFEYVDGRKNIIFRI